MAKNRRFEETAYHARQTTSHKIPGRAPGARRGSRGAAGTGHDPPGSKVGHVEVLVQASPELEGQLALSDVWLE